jgi:hypothetical protein
MPQIDIGAGSYPAWADQDFADEYLAADISRAAAWALLGTDAKGRALVSAARLIARLNWLAGAAPDYESAPAPIAEANAVLAADLAADPGLSGSLGQESNIKRVKAGSAEVEFRPGGAGQSVLPLPSEAWALIAGTGLVSAPGGGDEPFYSGGDFPSRFRPDVGYPDPETDWRL